jgi:putative (di)nucleoside polyphosphate hydrolase
MIPARPSERTGFEPRYRPCVGIVLANPEGLVFAGRRADRPEAAWQMPQGGIDEGEDAATAALREIEEETGLAPPLARIERVAEGATFYDVPPDLLPAHWGGRYRGQAITWALLRFLGRDADVAVATAHPEFSDWRWAPLPELVEGIVAWKRTAYARAVEEFGERP